MIGLFPISMNYKIAQNRKNCAKKKTSEVRERDEGVSCDRFPFAVDGAASSARTMSAWPCSAARCSGVSPLSLAASARGPSASSARIYATQTRCETQTKGRREH